MLHSVADSLALSRLEDLKDTAQKLSIEIIFADLSDPEFPTQSGACKFRGEDLILVDNRLPAQRQINVILNIFQQFNWDDVYIPSWIREHLENSKLIGTP
jgi:hypothetical protein